VMKLADHGLAALDRDAHLAAGLNVKNGKITHAIVSQSLGFDSLSSGAKGAMQAAE
jgi:alanine dehydrogenase